MSEYLAFSGNPQTNEEELQRISVFGYTCKLFRDDERSIEVNNGGLLVPWFGDTSLMMDRFDCRGYLNDLKVYDGDIYAKTKDNYVMTPEERAMEEACNAERYLELHMDCQEAAILEEEEKKRSVELLRSDYGAVEFVYIEGAECDGGQAVDEDSMEGALASGLMTTETDNGDSANSTENEDEVLYKCPPELRVPPDVEQPRTDKEAAIIEKTALFIARQGTQMEIIVKTKQKSNPQFSFLNYDHSLNPFYRHVVQMIRTAKYTPRPRYDLQMAVERDAGQQQHTNKSIHEDSYELKLPKVDISNTAYATLINRFKLKNELQQNSAAPSSPKPSTPTTNNETDAEMDSEGAQRGTATGSAHGSVIPTTREEASTNGIPTIDQTSQHQPVPVPKLDQCYQDYYQHYYAYYYNYYFSAAQHSSSSSGNSGTAAEVDVNNVVSLASSAAAVAASAAISAHRQVQLRHMTAVTAAAAAAASADKKDGPGQSLTTEQRGIIDKMAEYVARNGPEFELVVRQKKEDPRFGFLDSLHPLHSYYQARRREAELQIAQAQARRIVEAKKLGVVTVDFDAAGNGRSGGDERVQASNESRSDMPSASGSDQPATSVSFKVRGGRSLLSATAGGGGEDRTGSPLPLVLGVPEEGELATSGTESPLSHGEPTPPGAAGSSSSAALAASSVAIATLITAEELERRLTQNQLRDQRASLAREKLANLHKETELQAQRRKKAATLVAQLKEQQAATAQTVASSTSNSVSSDSSLPTASATMKSSKRHKTDLEEVPATAAVKVRRREKTPPAAYAKSTSRRRSRSPKRGSGSDRDRHKGDPKRRVEKQEVKRRSVSPQRSRHSRESASSRH